MADTRSHSFAIRGLAAGAIGGVAAATVDFAWSHAAAVRFLPVGAGRLWLFLALLYGGAAALVGLAGGLVVRAIGRTTDLGALARSALGENDESPGRPLVGYAVGAVLAMALVGVAVWGAALTALYRFHAHLPIAAVVGVAAALLAIPGVIVAALVARATPALAGPRLRPRLDAPVAWMAGAWLAGLGAAAAGVLILVDNLALRRRMTIPLKALNAGLWSPVIVAAAVIGCHLVGRFSWRLVEKRPLGARLRPLLAKPTAAIAVVIAQIAVGAGVAIAATWQTAQIIDWRPIGAPLVGLAVAAAALAFGAGAWIDRERTLPRVAAAILLPPLLLALAHRAGEPDRVRKAAFSTGLAPPLLVALQHATDWDRDGYSSALGFGPDCNDRDPEIHPGAFDWPDDGIDQNCNGHEATANVPPRPPYPPVPITVPKPLNIVLVTIDAVRADHVGAYGYGRPTTPVIDAVAREGALFMNGWAHSPSTRYSVPAILIGRYESTIAWNPDPRVHWPPLILDENHLISEALHERGFFTMALTSAHYFEPTWGLNQGFDVYDNSLSHLHANPYNGDPARATGSSSRELADLAIKYLDAHGTGPQPFFLWVHFYDPHYLYEAHPDCAACQFGSSEIDRYDGEIRYTDIHIGRVLDELRKLGVYDKTAVFITADHGEGFGEHGVKQHGYHIYAQQNKVPFIARVPGIAPHVVDDPVGHVDLFPTLLNLVGAHDEKQLLGRSLVGLIAGAREPERLVFGEVEYEGPVVRKSVASRDWHLIQNVTPDGTFELYHLAADPQENLDLDGQGFREEAQLKQALAAWMDETALPPGFVDKVRADLANAPIPSGTKLDAEIGGLLALDGYDVRRPAIHVGEAAEIAVVMHPVKAIPRGWKLFTHVVAPDGRFLNADHEPLQGALPIARLRPGQWVRDRVRVTVPAGWPRGAYTVEYGLFRGNERAPVKGGGDQATVARFTVE